MGLKEALNKNLFTFYECRLTNKSVIEIVVLKYTLPHEWFSKKFQNESNFIKV